MKPFDKLEVTNAKASKDMEDILAEVREETLPKAPPASEEIDDEVEDNSQVTFPSVCMDEVKVKDPNDIVSKKIRVVSLKGATSYVYATTNELADVCQKLENDENVKSVTIFEYLPPTSEPVLQLGKTPAKVFVPTASPFFSKPYTLDQIDLRDKVQIANFARQTLADPADSLFPPIQECTYEQLIALTEFQMAKYNMCLDYAKQAHTKRGMKDVQDIRNEGENFKKAKRAKVEKELTKGKTSSEVEKLARKNASLHGQDAEHKSLLKFISIMGVSIEGFSVMTKDELKAKVAELKADMMGKK